MTEGKVLQVINNESLPFIDEIEWVVQDLIVRGGGTTIAGQPGVSKTVHSAVLAVSTVLGIDFGPFRIPKAVPVLYVDYDSNYAQLSTLFTAVSRGLGYAGGIPDNLHFYFPGDPRCQFVDGSAPPLDLAHLGRSLAATVKELKIGVVFIDSFMQAMNGQDPSSASDVVTTLRQGLTPVLLEGAAVVIVDHTSKGVVGHPTVPTPFGSQSKRAWSRISVIIEAENVSGEGKIRWSVDKTNFKKFAPFWTEVVFREEDGRLSEVVAHFLGSAAPRNRQSRETKHDSARREILDMLSKRSHCTRGELPEGTTGDRAINELIEDGEIVRLQHGKYALSQTVGSEATN